MNSAPRTIRAQVTEQLRTEVVSGQLEAGTPLRENEIAQRFGVSRGPVRDAFLQLSQEGLLVYQPNRGVTVGHPPDEADRKFLMDLRSKIEQRVLHDCHLPVDDKALGALRGRLEHLKQACHREDLPAVTETDIQFHQTMLEILGGKRLIPIWKQVCLQIRMAYTRVVNFDQIYQEHLEILEAIENGDIEQALASLGANLQ